MTNKYIILSIILIKTYIVKCSCPPMIPVLKTLTYFSCEQMQSSQYEKGVSILQDQKTNLFSITTVGWYRLIGKLNQNYLLIQSRNSATDNIIRIAYNPVKMQIQCTILDVELSPFNIANQVQIYLHDKWFFIRIGINLQDQISNKSYIYYTIIYEQNQFITQSLIQTSQFTSFNNQNFEYFYGSTSYYPYSRSCAVSQQVLAFLGKANDSSQGPFLEISQFEMFMLPKLFLHFNFFMASSNYLYNQNDDFKSCIQIPLFKQYAIKYPYYKQQQDSMLYYDYILDIKEAQGFIIELDIQVSNNDGNSFPVVLKLHSIGYDLFYFIGIDSLSNIYDQYKNMDQIIYFYLNGNLISTLSFKYNMNSKQFTFYLTNMQTSDSEESRRLLQFRNAKVYLGGFVQQCDDCILKISDQDCLYCANESDYLEEAQNSSCKSSCSNPFQNLIDSKTRTCSFTPDQGMCDNGQYTGRDRFFSNDCTCPKGLYYDQIQQKCLNCLQYCNTCKKADSCETYISQSYNGQCDKNSFNNGIECVSSFLKIVNKQNLKFKVDLSQITCSKTNSYSELNYQIKDDALKLGHSSNSFFFSLNFNLQIQNLQFNDIYTICYLKNENDHIFSIISYVNDQQNLELQFIDSSKQILLKAPIESNNFIWIGFYYDQYGINLLVKQQNEQISFYSSDIKNIIKQNLDSPIIVFGIQSPLYSNTYPLCGYISSNNWIVKGDSSMRSFPNVLLNFSQEDLKIILDFYFFYYSEQFQSNQNLIVNKIDSSITLKMQQPSSTGAYSFDQTKGIQFGIIQAIIDSDNKLNQFPFVIKITFAIFEQLECFGRIEQLLQLNNNNDMLFQFKLRSKYLDQKYYLEDETYLEFPQYKYMAPFQFKIALGGDNYIVGYNFIYFTSLQIYSGGFYYVNYDNSDPCFVYLNRQNMTCIYPKQGYALNKYGVVISTADCNQDIKQNEPLYFYNIYTMMCQNSGIVLPNCRNINIIDQKCTQCIESQMILSKNCQCPDGMFFNQISQSCKRCSPLCKTCSVNKDNCLECKNPDNIPPQCDCTQHNYFIDNNLGCQKCSQQCESCIQNSSYCLSCSDGRIHPPLCYCNPALYLNNYSDPITNSCQPKRCPNKCLVCDLNNECVLCRGDRILPPYCLCTEDYYDDPLIEYEFCQKCQNGFYFDDMQQKCISFDTQQMQKYYIEASFNTQFSNDQYQIMLSFVVSENSQKLTLYIKLLQNIQQTPAFLLFKKTQIFQNEEFKFVLNPIYSQIPYQFNIGPYFKETTMTILLGNIPENQYIVSIVSQLQIVFYILNSIQPTSMFILLNIQIPPNLYQFLQQYAKYVYRHVPETQSDYTQNSFSLFGLNVNKYVNSANQEKLKRLGFSDSLLVNCQMILSDYPQIICVCCSILNIITAFITGYLRPYNQIPYQFNIGPYFKETTMAILLGNIPENQCIPTTMFILLNIQIPPNLYQFLQQFAKYIYRHVLENQSDYTQNSFRLFILSVKKYVNSANQGKLKRLGFGDSLLEILIDINDLDNKLQQPTFLKNSFGFK
ncbi:hypothetical protein ABPG73_001396 [Tetrahymena malaccensis]